MPNALDAHQRLAATDAQIGNDHASAVPSGPRPRVAATASRNRCTVPANRSVLPRGKRDNSRRAPRPARSGSAAAPSMMPNAATTSRPATRANALSPTSRSLLAAETCGPANATSTEKMRHMTSRSSRRSITLVAKTAARLNCSRRARTYGRASSPRRPGSRVFAANPMTVARRVARKLARPTGRRSRRQRSARSRYEANASSPAAASRSGRALPISPHTRCRFALRRKNAIKPSARTVTTTVRTWRAMCSGRNGGVAATVLQPPAAPRAGARGSGRRVHFPLAARPACR